MITKIKHEEGKKKITDVLPWFTFKTFLQENRFLKVQLVWRYFHALCNLVFLLKLANWIPLLLKIADWNYTDSLVLYYNISSRIHSRVLLFFLLRNHYKHIVHFPLYKELIQKRVSTTLHWGTTAHGFWDHTDTTNENILKLRYNLLQATTQKAQSSLYYLKNFTFVWLWWLPPSKPLQP